MLTIKTHLKLFLKRLSMFGINKNLSIHFIGIGGIGMSGIAEILIRLGYQITGSDLSNSEVVENLRELGATIHQGHKEENVHGAQIVVYSSAITKENPEYNYAIEHKIPLIKRAEMLAELMRLKHGIAVAGSHGKTTTTSFLAAVFNYAKYEPTHIIGGVVKSLGGNAKSGKGNILIAEADESDGSFLFLNPIHSVITNIDDDHLDHYITRENIVKAFVDFANKIPFYGCIALSAHDKNISEKISEIKRPYVTFGIKDKDPLLADVDYLVTSIEYGVEETTFTVFNEGEETLVKIGLMGEHNVLNALAAFSISHQIIKDKTLIAKGLESFQGVSRRLEKLYDNKLLIVDDYAHHPTEITAALSAIKKYGKRVVVVFEPHRFTRTKDFWNEFVEAFSTENEVYILPIYPASEKPIPYIDAEILVKNINEKNSKAVFLKGLEDLKDLFVKYRKSDDVVIITMGAGPISKKAREYIKDL